MRREEPKRKSSQGRGTALSDEPDDEGDLHIAEQNGRIRVEGEEAMEPNLESLGEREGGATQDEDVGVDDIIIIIYLFLLL